MISRLFSHHLLTPSTSYHPPLTTSDSQRLYGRERPYRTRPVQSSPSCTSLPIRWQAQWQIQPASCLPSSLLSSAWCVAKSCLQAHGSNMRADGNCFGHDLWLCVHGRSTSRVHVLTRATGLGAAYGTAKSGIGIAGVGTYRPDLIMKVSCKSPPFHIPP